MTASKLFAQSATDSIMDLAAENASWISPFLANPVWRGYAASAKLHRSDIQHVDVVPRAGAAKQSNRTMEATGFLQNMPFRVSNTAKRFKSTAQFDKTETFIMTDSEMSGASGADGYTSTEQYIQSALAANVRSAIKELAEICDQAMFEDIFAIMSKSTSSDSAAPTETTVTFANDVTKSYTQTTDFTSTTATGESLGLGYLAEVYAALTKATDTSPSVLSFNKQLVHFMPREYLFTLQLYLNLVRANENRRGAQVSDGTFEMLYQSAITFNGLLQIGLPYKWFYTSGADAATRNIVTIIMTFDAFVPYCPIQNENILQLGLDMIHPRATTLRGKIANMNFQSWMLEESSSAYGSLDAQDIVNITGRFNDPMVEAMANAYDRRHPESTIPLSTKMQYSYSPLSYKVYTSNLPVSTTALTSYSTAMDITRWAGGIRAHPHQIIQFNMPCSLFPIDLSAHSKPLVTTFIAMQSMSDEGFKRWINENKDIVRKDIDRDKAKRAESNSTDVPLEDMLNEHLKYLDLGTFKNLEDRKVKYNKMEDATAAEDRIELDVKRSIAQAKSIKDMRKLSKNPMDHNINNG